MTTLDAEADEAARRVLDLALKLGGRKAARGTDGGALLDGDLVGLGGGSACQHVGHDLMIADRVGGLDRVGAIAHALHRVLRVSVQRLNIRSGASLSATGRPPPPLGGRGRSSDD